MSLKVLAIPEDGRYDQYIVRPLLQGLLASLGKPSAKVLVHSGCGGYADLLRWECLQEIVQQYRGMVDLFVVCVDRDGDPNRRAVLNGLEDQATKLLADRPGQQLIGVEAWQEVEVWFLAAVDDLPRDWPWVALRDERDSKERYFEPFMDGQDPKWREKADHGLRDWAAQIKARTTRVGALCDEVAALRDRLQDSLDQTA
ncbi:MAG: hypothetical protein IT204_03035 [Fimbriimonadaceae bacterium]|nr:hypothetical protein [Fimbriimonadaceae bacterium]